MAASSSRCTSPRTWSATSWASSRRRGFSRDTAGGRRPRRERRSLRRRADGRRELRARRRRRALRLRRRVEVDGMKATATLRYMKGSAQKVRLVADLVRGKSVNEAVAILHNTHKVAAKALLKTLKSAVAN